MTDTKKGLIFDIQRFSVHDGPGIRTTVFMKGCPLHCAWCHNPEGLSGKPQIQFSKDECLHCGRCHGEHTERNVPLCPSGALKICGRAVTDEELLRAVLRDRDFYGPDGGVTFSGGECLLQADFVTCMLQKCHEAHIHTTVDTSGFAPWTEIEKTLPHTDLYLYDLKCADPALHKQYTGVDNHLIHENFRRLGAVNKPLWVRVPVIPSVNDNDREMTALATLAASVPTVKKVTLMPYHTLGKSQYQTLGLTAPYDAPYLISPAALTRFASIFEAHGLPVAD